jgi:ribonuclease HI
LRKAPYSEQRAGVAQQKFYAVRKGRVPGLYFSWEDCAREVIGFKGAEHKRFGTLADAEVYLFQGLAG